MYRSDTVKARAEKGAGTHPEKFIQDEVNWGCYLQRN